MEKNDFLVSCDAVGSLHFPRWQELPEFELYMDQVIALAEKYLSVLTPDHKVPITPSMINNYVKSGALPPPKNKKYNRSVAHGIGAQAFFAAGQGQDALYLQPRFPRCARLQPYRRPRRETQRRRPEQMGRPLRREIRRERTTRMKVNPEFLPLIEWWEKDGK